MNKLTKDEGGTEGPTTGPGPGEVTDGGEVVNPPKKPKDPRLTVTKKANKQFFTLGQPVSYRITVKRAPPPSGQAGLPAGLASNHLHDRVREGDVLRVKAPSGHFHIDMDANLPPC